ncbi:hypothetical protein OCH239_05735 [Roseivivax halodurans JCM 10272]|uniref:DUF3859 domain-containing protein n=1 Tax=Roseivivax halodurans JCM 10272 TaxID=1449350 RepID=X7EFZ0_9RHOB|nr:DUF3859 domain-containing protein [Roseivivax halodurans]ETX14018.1 hypothetical protein OCH239_05735 [Roseivivax halodurans JCM 10272]
MLRSVLALLLVSGPALAETAQYDPDRFEVTQGVFCEVPSSGRIEAPGTVAGHIELFAESPEFEWLTNVVPAVNGLSFGVKTEALDGMVYDGVVLTLTHPQFAESGATAQSYVTMLGGASSSINAYTFDTKEELATGTWSFTATRNGDILYSALFEVVPPEAAPEIASACGGLPIS